MAGFFHPSSTGTFVGHAGSVRGTESVGCHSLLARRLSDKSGISPWWTLILYTVTYSSVQHLTLLQRANWTKQLEQQIDMYHSIQMAVSALDVSQRARQLRPRTTRSGTCGTNHHHGLEFLHRARSGIREGQQDMRARSEPDLWLYKSLENSSLMSDPTEHHGERDERRDQPKTMRWPCNHHWGKWACNRWVNTMGAKCQECKNRKDMDSTPTHTRLAHMYDVDVLVEGFRNAGLNAACVVDMMNDGASERALHDALKVIQENDVAWHDRVEHIVLLGIFRWKSAKAKKT